MYHGFSPKFSHWSRLIRAVSHYFTPLANQDFTRFFLLAAQVEGSDFSHHRIINGASCELVAAAAATPSTSAVRGRWGGLDVSHE
eukprot:4513852-Prymnesium_polylepis.1